MPASARRQTNNALRSNFRLFPQARGAMKRSRYFRTQITRTTAAFASDDPPDAFTPCALRNSRTVPADTRAACAAGAAFAGPATSTGFNNAMPGKLAVAIDRSRAGKAERGSRRERDVAGLPICDRSLDAARSRAAALALRIGDAGEIERGLRRGAGDVERLQAARAVDAQQREIMLLVHGNTVGIAMAANRDGDTVVGHQAVGDDSAVLTDHDAGAVFDGLARRRARRSGRRSETALNALDIAITTGSTVFSVA